MPPRPKLPENLLELTGYVAPPALEKTDISRLSSLLDASPEEFQKAASVLLRKLAIQGFGNIQAPRNYKEQATVLDLLRKFEGLDKGEKGAMPVGLVGVLRSVNRRAVVDAVTVEDGEIEGFE